ncbi:hypothetical protein D3C87_2208800 [compost metagenome]
MVVSPSVTTWTPPPFETVGRSPFPVTGRERKPGMQPARVPITTSAVDCFTKFSFMLDLA